MLRNRFCREVPILSPGIPDWHTFPPDIGNSRVPWNILIRRPPGSNVCCPSPGVGSRRDFSAKGFVMTVRRLIVILGVLSAAAPANTFVVAPNAQASLPGTFPGILAGTNTNIRRQQVIGPDQFQSNPILINQIALRAFPGTGAANATVSSLNLYLSTSPYFPNASGGKTQISNYFQENVGLDSTLVYSGPVALNSAGCAFPTACSFDIVISFTTPFLYNPSQGALLLDFQMAGFTAVGGALDSVSFASPGGPIATVSGQLNSPNGDFDAAGYVVQIGYILPNSPCTIGGSVYPCSIAGTLLLINAPAGNLFAGGGGAPTSAFIADPRNPGFELTQTPPVQRTGPGIGTLQSLTETLSFVTANGQPTITGASASITCGVKGAATYSLTLSATGPPLVLNCPTFPSSSITGNVTGQISFPAVSNLTVTLTATGAAPTSNDTVSFGGFSIQLQLPSASPQCTYGLSPNGQGFGAAGGAAAININTAPGCSWSLFNIPSWVVPTTATTGTGSGSVGYQVQANAAGDRTAAMSLTGVPFQVEQEAASIPGLNFIGSLAHLAAQENWTTAFTLVDKGNSPATARLSFFGDAIDPSGNGPLAVPLVFPPPGGLPLQAASIDRTLPANGSLIVNTAGSQTPPVLVGSLQLSATAAVDGFAIFHQIVTTQEAVVPLETRNASSYLLAFDNTNGLVLGVALVNVSAANTIVPVIIRDETGAVISAPSASISLAGNGHFSFVLSVGFPVTANKRGTVEFDTLPGGQISVLGLRFTPPNNALTTIPALANVGTGGGSIAHLASGGDGWQTTFVLVNTGTSAAQFTLNFFGDQTGAPLPLPLAFPQASGGPPTVASFVTQNLAAGATLVIVSEGATNLLTGSAQLTTAGNISGFVIFRHNDQEAVVPLESRNANGYIIAFDNTNGTATGIAVNAVSAGPVQIPVTIRDSAGAPLGFDNLTLNANGHTQFTLGIDKYLSTANIRGTIEFNTPFGAHIGALGIRIPTGAAHTYTTLPALAK